jgi:hypothetical protein
MDDGEAVADNVKLLLTVKVTVVFPVHPEAVPVTVYTVVAPGLTETGVPVRLPGIQEKVVPGTVLFAVNEEDALAHMLEGVASADITGLGFTFKITVLEPVQPNAVPVTL